MKKSLQDLLFHIPLHQLTFYFSLPKQPLFFESVAFALPEGKFADPTLLIINRYDELKKLNNISTAHRILQDLNLTGIVLCLEEQNPVEQEIINLFRECCLPVVQVNNRHSLKTFVQNDRCPFAYGNISVELYGFMQKGFVNTASQLALAFDAPLLYLDEQNHLMWHTGKEDEVREAVRWVNTHRRVLDEAEGPISSPEAKAAGGKKEFDIYSINVAGKLIQKLVAPAGLSGWQKRMLDKLAGLTALMLQTEGMFLEQQQQFKEHFIYDLLYHKFESKKVMVKQAKSWGWNLETPHHLLVVDVILPEAADGLQLDRICAYLENTWAEAGKPYIAFPFQDQIIVLVEDGEKRTVNGRKKFILNAAAELEKELAKQLPEFQFQIGIGKWYKDTLYLNKSYQEAKLALKFGKLWLEGRSIFHINDLGVLRLLIHVHEEILADYCEEYLSQLRESDKTQGTEYIKTLKAYIEHRGATGEISEALFIHPNTLRNRTKKIEEMTGIDLQDPQEFMNLIVALKIYSLLHHEPFPFK